MSDAIIKMKNNIHEIEFKNWKNEYNSWCALEIINGEKVDLVVNPITMVRAKFKNYSGPMHLYEVEFSDTYFDDHPVRITSNRVDDEKFYGTLISPIELPLVNNELIIDMEKVKLINKTESIVSQEYCDLMTDYYKESNK